MRTTLTIEDDVAALIRRLRERRKASLKTIVNEALRQGLKQCRRRHGRNAVAGQLSSPSVPACPVTSMMSPKP